MNAPHFLDLNDGRRLAYHRTFAKGELARAPGVAFLGGFASDMTGTKAAHLQLWAEARGCAFLRFDYTGHGASSGRFAEGCVGDWARDARDALAHLTEGPQILVGSSMGGWIALLIAREAPERVAALVGIAAAPDFTEDAMWRGFSAAQRAELAERGEVVVPSDYDPAGLTVTRRLIEDGRDNLVLRTPLHLPFPVRLLQGTADVDVPPAVGLRLLDHIDAADLRLTLVKRADHRFSGPAELALLTAELDALLDRFAAQTGQSGIGAPA
ncbi:alpha/beta hydrolase [Rubrimonas sp.]|uniref:alpha/beta hydrolase n=1 Tax=Rubrimonas sp. TaxID=2036015 RepID=UPI002FDD4152